LCKRLLTAKRPPNPAYPKHLKTIGDQIRSRRLDLGLTQKQIAEIIGVTETSIYNWERAMNPAVQIHRKIQDWLGETKSQMHQK
jgi:DNA-binding XRE family transcriptional regulator